MRLCAGSAVRIGHEGVSGESMAGPVENTGLRLLQAIESDFYLMTVPFDPQTLQDVLTGLSANALWSLIALSGAKAVATLDRRIVAKSANMFTAAGAAVAAEFAQSDKDKSRLRRFLSSPDVESIVRQIYAMKAVERDGKDLDTIQREFLIAFAKHLDVSVEKARSAADAIFQALVSECDAHFSAAIEANLLGAHESRSNARHRRLLGELASIKRNLDLLTTANDLDLNAVLTFEESYRAQVAGRHGHIQPPHLETARKYPIDELYVTPMFLSGPIGKQREAHRVTLENFLNSSHRTVVLAILVVASQRLQRSSAMIWPRGTSDAC